VKRGHECTRSFPAQTCSEPGTHQARLRESWPPSLPSRAARLSGIALAWEDAGGAIKSKVTPGSPFSIQPDFYGAKPATRRLHPLAGHSAENCTEQLGIPGPWYDRLPHFRMNFTPSAGHELQTEYFVPREKGYEAVLAVEKLRDKIRPHLMITELRTIDADDLWMSTCYKRKAMTLHFTWQPDWEGVQSVLPLIEEQLAPFDPRPHWAKVFTMKPAKIQGQYARLADFKALAKEYDPHGKFRNAFIQTNLYDG